MARQNINYGTNPNDGTGDKLRTAMDKINSNFIELYNNISQNITVSNAGIINTQPNANINIKTSGIGAVQINQGLQVNTDFENDNSVFYAADGNTLLSIDVQNKRIGINKSSPVTTLDVVGNAAIAGNFSAAGSVTLGSTSSDLLAINGIINSNLIPLNVNTLGNTSNRWHEIHANNIIVTSIVSSNITTNTVSANTIVGNISGQLTTNTSIRINNNSLTSQIITEPLTSSRQIAFPDTNGTVVTKNNGRIAGVSGMAPITSVGIVSDRRGDIAFDSDYIYYCTADYDGSTSIWKRSSLSTW